MNAEHVLAEPKADRFIDGHIEMYAPNDEDTDDAALMHELSYAACASEGMLSSC